METILPLVTHLPLSKYFLKPFPRKGMETNFLGPNHSFFPKELSQTFSPQGDGNEWSPPMQSNWLPPFLKPFPRKGMETDRSLPFRMKEPRGFLKPFPRKGMET